MKNFLHKNKWWIISIAYILFPLFLEGILRHGLFGWKPLNTIFELNDWLAFWGSYLGGGFTIGAIIVSIYINNSNLKIELEKEERAFKQELKLQKIAFEHEIKKERIFLEKERIENYYNTLFSDLDKMIIIMDVKLSLTNADKIKQLFFSSSSLNQAIEIIQEISIFQMKYEANSQNHNDFFKYISSIKNDLTQVFSDVKELSVDVPSREEAGEVKDKYKKESSALYDKLGKIFTSYKLNLRLQVEKYKSFLTSEKFILIEKLNANGGKENE